MLTKVVDTSGAKSDALRDFLSASPHNRVVLCPPFFMENMKSLSRGDSFNDFAILRDYPNQILVTKEMEEIKRIRGTAKSVRDRLISKKITRTLRANLHERFLGAPSKHSTTDGYSVLLSQMARDSVEQLSEQVSRLQDTHAIMAAELDAKDVRAFRRGLPCSRQFWEIFALRCADLTGRLFEISSNPVEQSKKKFLPYTYFFRHSLLANCYFLDWLFHNSPTNTSPAKIANDVIDLRIASISTFYDGLITTDIKQSRILSLADWALSEIAAYSSSSHQE